MSYQDTFSGLVRRLSFRLRRPNRIHFILTVLLVLLAYLLGKASSQSDLLGNIGILLLLLVALSFLAAVYVYFSYKNIRAKFRIIKDKHARAQSVIVSALHDMYVARHNLEAITLSRDGFVQPIEDYKTFARMYVDIAVNQVKRIADAYTNSVCSVTIKLLEPSLTAGDPLPTISTYTRDRNSALLRKHVDARLQNFPYTSNTAFDEIIKARAPSGRYVCNDLRREEMEGQYANSNTNWRDYYNATVVVPIKSPNQNPQHGIAGFLCVDNWEGGFNDDTLLQLLKLSAMDLYIVFRNVAILERRVTEKSTNE